MSVRRGYTDSQYRIPPGWRVIQQDQWPINNYDSGGKVDLKNWRFETSGEVEIPLSLTYEEFRSLPSVTKSLDHHCIDGWSYLGQVWDGVEFAIIKEKTVVRDSTQFVLIEGRGASQRFPIGQDLFFAFGQDGAPLSSAAGYPLRILAPGEFGNRSIKWVTRVTFCREPLPDSKTQKYREAGIYDLYIEKIADKNPWTVDIGYKKKFLRGLFGYNTQVKREKKRKNYLEPMNSSSQSPIFDREKSVIEICKVSELETNSCKKFVVMGNEILLLNSKGDIRAIEPLCTHQGTDISKGKYNPDAGTIRCPLHGAIFDTRDGSCLSGSYGIDGDNFPPIRSYKIRVDSGTVYLENFQEWGRICD